MPLELTSTSVLREIPSSSSLPPPSGSPQDQRVEALIADLPLERPGSSSLISPSAERAVQTLPAERHLTGKEIDRFSVRQYFEGMVLSLRDSDRTFIAHIVDLTNPTMADE